jgi:hypothetical protein
VVLQREGNPGSGFAGGAAANRIDDDHQGSGCGDRRVDVGDCSQFLDTQACQLLAHRFDEKFRIGHASLYRGA